MPRTRKTTTWMAVVDNNPVVMNIKSKTYCGACHKALKKLGLPRREHTKTLVSDPLNPEKIQYKYNFPGVYCTEQ